MGATIESLMEILEELNDTYDGCYVRVNKAGELVACDVDGQAIALIDLESESWSELNE